MKKLFVTLIALFSAVAVKASDIQFDRVNTAMQVIADAVVFGDELVEYGKPEFDEKFSDLKTERLRYSLSGVVKNSPWLTGTRTEIRSSCTLIADRNPVHLGIEVSSEAQVKTDVLAMIRQGAITALKSVNGMPEKFEARIKENLRKTSQVISMDEFYQILIDSRQLSQEILEDKIKKEQEYLACLKSGNCGQGSSLPLEEQVKYQEKRIEDYTNMKTSYVATVITPLPNDKNVQKLVLTNNSPNGFFRPGYSLSVKAQNGSLTLEATELKANANGFIFLKQERMDRLKMDLDKILFGLQTGELQTKEDTFRTFRDGLYHFKRVISGEWPKHN